MNDHERNDELSPHLSYPTAPPEWQVVDMEEARAIQRTHLKSVFSNVLDLDMVDSMDLAFTYGDLEIKIYRRRPSNYWGYIPYYLRKWVDKK